MARNHQEWSRKRKEYGAWDYTTNKKVIDQFFREGIERMQGTEDIVTIGMRGDGDAAMQQIIDGCMDISDEVGTSKIGKPHTGEDKNYIESPYSENSITDFYDNILSIQNSYMGGIDGYFGGNDCLWCFLHKDCKKCSDVWATSDTWHDKKAD